MAQISNFIPSIWSARFLSNLEDYLIWGSRCNRTYEGEIQAAGDTVKIPTSTTTVTVNDYAVDTDIADPELAKGTTQDLDIDKQKYFHLYVDDIDATQSRPSLMNDAMREAAQQMAEQVDSDIRTEFNTAYAAARQVTSGGSSGTSQKKPLEDGFGKEFIDAVIQLARMMSVAKIPANNRWLTIHPDVYAGLNRYFLTDGNTGTFTPNTDEGTLRNGFLGRLVNFDLYESNLQVDGTAISSVATWRLFAGQGLENVTFANQITETETYRPEKRFGNAVKGLMVYGSKVVLPSRLFTLRVKKHS